MKAVPIDAKGAALAREQQKQHSLLVCAMLSLLLIFTAAFNVLAHAAGSDDYVDAIEAEGSRLEVLGRAKKEQSALMRSSMTPRNESHKVSAGQRNALQAEFERDLSNQLPGSYALYTMLSSSEKSAVYGEYTAARSEGVIRFLPVVNKIVSLYSNKQWSGDSANSRPNP